MGSIAENYNDDDLMMGMGMQFNQNDQDMMMMEAQPGLNADEI